MIIRKLESKDKISLANLLEEFYEFTLANIKTDFLPYMTLRNKTSSLKAWTKSNYNKGNTVYVAEENDKIVGFICCTIRNKKGTIFNKEGHIENLFVSKNFRKKGIGKKLYEKAIEDFKKLQCTHIGLFTFFDYKGAIAFYKSLGLEPFDMQLKKKLEYEK
jgi:ribosomal protein S18 acetylase RimI-like enzyme